MFTACQPSVLSPHARCGAHLLNGGPAGLTTDETRHRAFLSSEARSRSGYRPAQEGDAQKGPMTSRCRAAPNGRRGLSSCSRSSTSSFNEGYAATAGGRLVRPGLCLRRKRLGRILAGLMPEDSEVLASWP